MRQAHLTVLAVLALILGSELVAVTMLFVTGRLNPEKLDRIAQVVRGDGVEAPEATAAVAPASQPARVADAAQTPAGTDGVKVRQRELERRESEVSYQQQQLQLQLKTLNERVAAFQKGKEAWETARKKGEAYRESAGRTKVLNLLVAMRPRSAKELVIRMPVEEAARLLGSIEERQASRILKEFKSPEELRRAKEILDLLGKGTWVAPQEASADARKPGGR